MLNARMNVRANVPNVQIHLERTLRFISNYIAEDKLPEIAEFLAREIYEIEEEYERILSDGYEEAYKMLLEERHKKYSKFSFNQP